MCTERKATGLFVLADFLCDNAYYHVESVLQKRLKRQDHPLLIVSISIYNIYIARK